MKLPDVAVMADSPLVAAVYARIQEMVDRGEIPAGGVLPPERQLALQLDVSRGVVRAAIKRLSADGVLEAKPRCKPVVRSSASLKIAGRRHLGIWLWPNTADYAAASILKGIQRSKLDPEVRLIVGSAPSGDWESILHAEKRFLESLAEDPVEACAIVWYLGGERNLSALKSLRRAEVPIVFVDRLPPKPFGGDFVGTDNLSSAELAVRHLIELGHRRIGLITNVDSVSSVREREAGYFRAMQSAGLATGASLVQREAVEAPSEVARVVHSLLDQNDPPTALFCINDTLALHVCETLEQQGVRVPAELSVVGFDGLLRWVPNGGTLTSAWQNFERIGQIAAELAIERLDRSVDPAFRHFLLEAPLMVRQSTGRPAERRVPTGA